MRLLRLLALALLMLVAAPALARDDDGWGPNQDEERILDFASAITVAPNGDLDVTETIRLIARNQRITHGIQRDFPTSYRTAAGQRTRVGFTVLGVERDGHAEPWRQLSLANGVRIRIGAADVVLPQGEHTYVIHYRTSRQIVYGEDHDELYWNVTGTGWDFPIDRAEARITLPAPAAFGNRAVYTGPQGAKEHNAQVTAERPGYIAFATTAPLGPDEGLTVAAAFPKGVIAAPDGARQATWWLEDWGPLGVALATIAGLIGYYARAWWKVGRGPRAGTIVPVFTPPDGLSPAAVRYVARMGFDDRAFSAAIVYLGVRGKLHIDQERRSWLGRDRTTLSRTDLDGSDGGGALPAPERSMWTTLFLNVQSIELKQENYATLQAAREALEDGLADAYGGVMFRRNADWAFYGLFLMVLAMLAVAVAALLSDPATSAGARFGLPLLAVVLLGGASVLHRLTARIQGGRGVLIWLVVALLGAAGTAAAIGTVGSALTIGTPTILAPLVMLPVAVSAFWWMAAPTPQGRALMDRIAGFRQYLSITEEHRLDEMHPPERTPKLFERYLPYAIALDVENHWAEGFAGVLGAAAAGKTPAGTVGWYSGSGNFWSDPKGFVGDVGSALASTAAAAATSPSSSGGGSGGGGSSGGGGGGGGGGGW